MNDGQAVTTKRTFSRETTISADIQAPPAVVWALLTNAPDYARWNSTVISVDGDIKPENRIALKSTLDESRTFDLTVKEFDPERQLVWGDRMGDRTYALNEIEGERTRFTMTEKIGGPLFPLFSRFIPPFDESFEQFVADLKKEAESAPKVES
ncbi:MAG: SRPBCC family protein [Rubrobacteraceae bacterium]